MPRVPEAAQPLADVLDQLTVEAAPELVREEAGGKVRCLACGHRCLVLPGLRGICQVRSNREGRLRVPFGYVGALQSDPTEKKPFFHVLPGSRALTFGMLGCDLHCPYCFTGEARVATSLGVRSLAELWAAGDPVADDPDHLRTAHGVAIVTDDGSQHRLRQVSRHAYEGELVRVQPRFLAPLEATPDHPVLATAAPGTVPPTFVPAAQLTSAHYLVVPRRHHFSEPVTIDVDALLAGRLGEVKLRRRLPPELVGEVLRLTAVGLTSAAIGAQLGLRPDSVRHLRSRWGTTGRELATVRAGFLVRVGGTVRFDQERRPGIPDRLPLSLELAELLGYYCAEGGVVSSRDRPNSHTVAFTFGLHEQELASRCALLLHELFGVAAGRSLRPTSLAVTVGKASVALLFEQLCGTGSAAKHVPAELYRAKRPIVEAFVRAYVAGDGHRYAGGKTMVTTVSEQLAWDTAWLVLRLGHLPALYRTRRPAVGEVQGRKVRMRPVQYSVFWYETAPSRRLSQADPDYHYVPIRKVTRRLFQGDVYNLDVEGRHTYLANVPAVHNCQNWLTSQALRDEQAIVPPRRVTAGRLAELAVKTGAQVIASSYNEPLITSEWAAAVMREGRRRGLLTAYISNGNATPEVLDFLRPLVDCYKVDLKAMSESNYRALGARLETVLTTIRALKQSGFWVEIVTLLISGYNDSEAEVREIARFLCEVDPLLPWHVTAFHPDYRMVDRDPTASRQLTRAAEIGEGEGLRYVYCGNLPGRVGGYEDTRCHGCGAALIRRLGYRILEDRLTPTAGRCPECGTAIPGRWRRPEPATC